MILHQQGPSYILFTLAGRPASAVFWDKLLTWNISLVDLVKALLLLQSGAVGRAACAVRLSGCTVLPLPGLPQNCRLVSWGSRSICGVSAAKMEELSQTLGYSFPWGLLGLCES